MTGKRIGQIILLIFLYSGLSAQNTVMKVACIGDSITYGAYIQEREKNSYPSQLRYWLGDGYLVENFGVSGATALSCGDYPYIGSEMHRRSLRVGPDIVVIMLGTNDTKPHNWIHSDKFKSSYQALIDSYRDIPSVPRIILATPMRCFLPEGDSISNSRIVEVGGMVRDIANDNSLEYIDLYGIPGEWHDTSVLPDGLHPSAIGAGKVAYAVGAVIDPSLAATPVSLHAVPGNEYRSSAGWVEGNDWHSVSDDITATIAGRRLFLLLLGDSITQGWGGSCKTVSWKPGKQALDAVLGEGTWESAGLSGDRTQNLLWRLRNCGYGSCMPDNVVIAIGINNLNSGDTPEDTAEGIIAVTEEAEKVFPGSRIILLGLFPSGKESDSEIRRKCDTVHGILAGHTFSRAEYTDPTEWFLAPDGSIRDGLYGGDYVHLTEAGYKVAATHLVDILGMSSISVQKVVRRQ